MLARYLYDRAVGRHRIPSTVPLDLVDSAGSVHDVTGPASSVKAIRGAESRAPNLWNVALLDPASPSPVTDKQTNSDMEVWSINEQILKIQGHQINHIR